MGTEMFRRVEVAIDDKDKCRTEISIDSVTPVAKLILNC